MHTPFTPRSLLSLAAIGLTLSACGGGCCDAPFAAVSAYSGIVTSVPASNYAFADNTNAFDRIRAIREGAGAGLLAQGNLLDLSAKGHTDYFVANSALDGAYLGADHDGVLGGHYEDPSKPGYKGQTAQDRATAAGYDGKVTELMSFGAVNGADCIESLENSVYHLAQIISPLYADVGISFNASNGNGMVCAIELGLPSNTLGQLPAAGSVVTYPFAGQTLVAPTFYNHAETPIPAQDLALAGHPVAVSLYSLAAPALAGGDIVIQSFAMTTDDGTPVAARLLAKSAVLSTGPVLTIDDMIADTGVVFLLPLVPLTANTTYRMTFLATVMGTAVSKNWSFSTGARR